MSDSKVLIKINRFVKPIGRNDLILDNGGCIHVITQCGFWGDYRYSPLLMSKKLFKDLKACSFIFVDEELTKNANKDYAEPFFTYYRFDIDRLISSGYEIWKGGV